MCSHQVSDHGLLFQNNDISINDDDEQLLADALIDKSDGNAADQFDFGCDSSSSDTAIDDVNHVSINKSIASSVKTRRKKPPSKSTSEESDIQPKHKHDTKISKQTSGGNTSLIQRIRSRRSIVKSKVKKGDFCLYSITDGDRINPLHTLIRRDILEGHVIDEDIVKGGHKVKGTVCFRCIWCKDQDEKSAYAAVYPRSIESIYRGIGRFQKKHISHCAYIPRKIKRQLKEALSEGWTGIRGDKLYWEISARALGLSDSEKGIVMKNKTKK